MFGREDIKTDGQHVFEMCCAFGDTRHIEVFMKRYHQYQWDIFRGMRYAVLHNNITNLHHLTMYHTPNNDELEILWDLATGGFLGGTRVSIYLMHMFEVKIKKEKLSEKIKNYFIDMLEIMLESYLKQGGEPFKITKEMVDEILKGTDDRLYKLDLLHSMGFEVEGLEEIKKIDEKDLPKSSARRYVELRPF